MKVATMRDIARQTAVVGGALFQVFMTVRAAAKITEVEETSFRPRAPIDPASYAYAIWPVIFALCLAYAGRQALPSQRDNRLQRAIGWWTALAFISAGAWSFFLPRKRLAAAQTMLLTMGASLAVAYLQVAAEARRRQIEPGERWIVAPAIGLFFGWMTAANPVNLLSFVGSDDDGRQPAVDGVTILGAATLLATGGFAAAMVRQGKAGPIQLYGFYAGTIAWAAAAIVANQYSSAPVIAASALAATAPVAGALLLPSRPASSGDPTANKT